MATNAERADRKVVRLGVALDVMVTSLEERMRKLDHAMAALAVQMREAEERRVVIREILDAVAAADE